MYDDSHRKQTQGKTDMNANEILTAPHYAFEMVNTHELKQGDIIRLYGMVVKVGKKEVIGNTHYHISEVLAIAQNSPAIGLSEDGKSWNVQGNKLAMWAKYKG